MQARESDLRIRFKDLPDTAEGGCHARVWLPKRITETINAVALYHGGAFTYGQDSDVPAGEVDYLLSRDVVVVSLQYRLAPHARFPEIMEDLLDGYKWVLQSLVDHVEGATRIRNVAVAGWSAGAHSAALVAAKAEGAGVPKPAATMLTYGLLDVEHPAILGQIDTTQEETEESLAEALKLKPETGVHHKPLNTTESDPRRRWLIAYLFSDGLLPFLYGQSRPLPDTYDPIRLATKDFPPTYVLVATKDQLIDTKQSYSFAARLKELGVEVQIGEADMGHGRSEVDWEGTEETKKEYQRWLATAIRPGLDFMVDKLRA